MVDESYTELIYSNSKSIITLSPCHRAKLSNKYYIIIIDRNGPLLRKLHRYAGYLLAGISFFIRSIHAGFSLETKGKREGRPKGVARGYNRRENLG